MRILFPILIVSFLITSCKEENQGEAPPPEVTVQEVIQQDVPIYNEFVGQIYGLKDIPIRARVEGYLLGLHFNEGSRVKKGQLLYTIDPDPFLQQVAEKKSELAKAMTILVNAENELKRYEPLVKINAVSQSDYDAAVASRDAALAGVEAAKANLRLSEIMLSYTKIRSPITGLIGKTEAREGEFVGKTPNPVILNTVSRIDTVRVQFFLSEREYLQLIKDYIKIKSDKTGNKLGSTNAEKDYGSTYNLDLILSDGSMYPHKGKVDFINRNVDPKTGSMLVQAHFPNPDRVLRPGLYAKVKAEVDLVKNALLVPQKSVSEIQGQHSVFVLNSDSTVTAKQVVLGERINDLWLVIEGLDPNDIIVVDGIQKIRSGSKVNALPVSAENGKTEDNR